MAKLEKLGCSKALVGLVVPTGYTFNADGTSLYMTLAALFVAQATNTHLTLTQQFTILGVAVLTSKGASGVQGAAFVALVATMMVIPTIPVAGMALILGIDRFLSMCRALVNMIANAVATLVIARWENEFEVIYSVVYWEKLRRSEFQPCSEAAVFEVKSVPEGDGLESRPLASSIGLPRKNPPWRPEQDLLGSCLAINHLLYSGNAASLSSPTRSWHPHSEPG
jgi:Sodium:dicarboxylate symporter family